MVEVDDLGVTQAKTGGAVTTEEGTMPRTWDALDGHRSRIYEEDGRYTVKVDAIGIDREDVITLAQTLLEAVNGSKEDVR